MLENELNSWTETVPRTIQDANKLHMTKYSQKMTVFQTEVEKVVNLLSKEIYAGEKLPNERLVEIELVEKYKVGRMVIREVLKRLESYGMVGIEPYKGATISAVTINQIREDFLIVAMLEGFSGRLAVGKITPKDIKRMEVSLEEQRGIQEGDNKAWQRVNRKFHKIINQRNGHGKLTSLIAEHIKFTNYWFVAHAMPFHAERFREHEQILKAIKKGDPDEVQQVMQHHVLSVTDTIIADIQQNTPLGMRR